MAAPFLLEFSPQAPGAHRTQRCCSYAHTRWKVQQAFSDGGADVKEHVGSREKRSHQHSRDNSKAPPTLVLYRCWL